jgi:hypothetical protein
MYVVHLCAHSSIAIQLILTLSHVKGRPNCAFGGTASDGLELLLSDPPEEGPQWVSMELRRIHMHQTAQQLSAEEELYRTELRLADQAELQLQRAREAADSLRALKKVESYFENAGSEKNDERSQQLWVELPLHLQEMIPQKSLAWLDLRSRHLFTGSSAFLLLLCGTGGRQQYAWIPPFRRGVWYTA